LSISDNPREDRNNDGQKAKDDAEL